MCVIVLFSSLVVFWYSTLSVITVLHLLSAQRYLAGFMLLAIMWMELETLCLLLVCMSVVVYVEFCAVRQKKGTNFPFVCIFFNTLVHSFQCFGAVGWAAGRASGL